MSGQLPPGLVPPRPPMRPSQTLTPTAPMSPQDQQQTAAQSKPRDVGVPNNTLYVRHINERMNLKATKAALQGIFGSYGKLLEIRACKNVRMRGQAHVVFEKRECADKALKVHGFPLFGQPLEVMYAKKKSQAIAAKEGEQSLEEFRREHESRVAQEERKRKFETCVRTVMTCAQKQEGNKYKKQRHGSLPGAPPMPPMPGMPPMMGMRPPMPQPAQQIPDELLPPHKILFIQHLPVNTKVGVQQVLQEAFSKLGGFVEVRVVPGRRDIAFVEFESEEGASAAKSALNGMPIDGQMLKITFSRK